LESLSIRHDEPIATGGAFVTRGWSASVAIQLQAGGAAAPACGETFGIFQGGVVAAWGDGDRNQPAATRADLNGHGVLLHSKLLDALGKPSG